MTSIWNRAHEWVRALVYIWSWYERLERNEYRCQQEHMNTIVLCCWANSRVRQWLIEDDTSLGVQYTVHPSQPQPLLCYFSTMQWGGWVLANIRGASSLIVPLLTFDTNFSFNLRPAHFKSSIRATFDQNFLWGAKKWQFDRCYDLQLLVGLIWSRLAS